MFGHQTSIVGLVCLIFTIQCAPLNITLAVVNVPAVVACGLSMSIYQSFNPRQAIDCPHISIDKDNIQLIKLNITVDDRHQLVIESYPPLTSPPIISIKLSNHSFAAPVNIDHNSTYYLAFSPELTCRYSPMHNDTVCFYYPASSSLILIEYHYDDIQQYDFTSVEFSRTRIPLVFTIVGILLVVVCCLVLCLICISRMFFAPLSQSDEIRHSHFAKTEVEKRPANQVQDDGAGQQC